MRIEFADRGESGAVKIYLLWHIHESRDDFGTHDEEKLLGVFSTSEKAEDSITLFRDLEGFRDFPSECFSIEEVKVDVPNRSWTEGFFTVRYVE